MEAASVKRKVGSYTQPLLFSLCQRRPVMFSWRLSKTHRDVSICSDAIAMDDKDPTTTTPQTTNFSFQKILWQNYE